MPRPKGSFKTPSLTLHKPSGRARVCIDGKDHYGGVYGTPEAQQKYERLIAEWVLRSSGHPRCSRARIAATRITENTEITPQYCDSVLRNAIDCKCVHAGVGAASHGNTEVFGLLT